MITNLWNNSNIHDSQWYSIVSFTEKTTYALLRRRLAEYSSLHQVELQKEETLPAADRCFKAVDAPKRGRGGAFLVPNFLII